MAHLLGALGHVTGKPRLGPVRAERFGNDHAGVIARQNDNAAQQILDANAILACSGTW